MTGRDGLYAGVTGPSNITSATRINVGNNRYRADALKNNDVTTDGSRSFRRKLSLLS
jgi:hypothetical protein